MRWEAPSLIEFARAAGFPRDMQPTVAAVALTSSGGNDAYTFTPGAPGCGRYVGLWAIDVDQWPEWAGRELTDPYEAARAAHELTAELGNLRWSPAWCSGRYRQHLDHCEQSMLARPFTERQHVSTGAEVRNAVHHELVAQIARAHNR